MREIEIKVRVGDGNAARASLEAAGVELSAPKEQHDVVYCMPGDQHKENDPSVNWLRLRTENKTTVYLTLKRSVAGSLDSIEHETVVESETEMQAILKYQGYIVFSDLTKIRRSGHIGDLEVCFDEVPQLGTFIELERLVDEDADGSAIEASLLETLADMGISYEERVTRGYDELMNAFLESTKSV